MRLALFLALVVSGCSVVPGSSGGKELAAGPPSTVEEYGSQRAALLDRLDDAIGEAEATSVAACRVLPVGEKACGGPTEYRVYSATDVVPGEVQALAEQIARLDVYASTRFEVGSTCDVTPQPTPALVDGRCVASGW